MDDNSNNILGSSILAKAVVVVAAWYARTVFGNDKMNWKQLIAFFILCGVVIVIVSLIPVSNVWQLTIMLAISMALPSLAKGFISGSKKSEQGISKSTEKNIKNISNKATEIVDIITQHKKDEEQ